MGCCSLTGRGSNGLTRREWLTAGACLAAASCAKRTPLPVYATVPAFRLVSQAGAAFDSSRLNGAPWLASLFFASCLGPCPRLNTSLHQVQEDTYGFQGLKLVSFTVDPENDTPEVLAAYARRYKADPERWYFLTGEREVISKVARDGFQVGALDKSRTHSTRVMLIDGRGRVRGHYPTAEKDELDALLAGIKTLYQEGM